MIFFVAANHSAAHWFLIPLAACGFTIGLDLADWLRRRINVFDPVGIMGALGFHFFFLAPLLHIHWNFWMRAVVPPEDWRPWLGGMAIINFVGLFVYRWARVRFAIQATHPARPRPRRILWGRFIIVASLALALTGVLQALTYLKFGGVMGYIGAFEQHDVAFDGMGWIFTLSERFPLILLLLYAVYSKRSGRRPSELEIFLVLIIFIALSLLFGGLRGSRSATIWSLFWATGILHLWIRPISRKLVYAGCIFLAGFMYLYGFYKSAGSEAIAQIVDSRSSIEELEERTGRSEEMVVLGDLARADVQALILQRMFTSDYQLAFGRTYIGGAVIFIPRSVWKSRPIHKVKEGTQVQYGMTSWREGGFQSSRIYGLAGEWMLNFGVPLVPIAFLPLGFVVGRTRRLMASLSVDDARWLMAPFLINLCFMVLCMDSDNLVVFLVKNGLLPALIIFAGSQRPAPRR